ncbi:uncharacterized protein LOC144880137 isoform X2 [Branchiostoma floridae x Branchiostoma japonicum]
MSEGATNTEDVTTPESLIIAAQEGHMEVVQQLLEAGAELNDTDQDGCTPLYMAASKNHVDVVQQLLKAGAEVDKAKQDGTTPLSTAAQNGHVEVVQQLLKAGAEVNKADEEGFTPLYVAAQEGHVEVVQQLLKAGAEVDKVAQVTDNEGSCQGITALHGAAIGGHFEVAAALLSASKGTINQKSTMGFFESNEKMTDITPLHAAAESGNLNIVNLLISAGADTTCTTIEEKGTGEIEGWSPYDVAVGESTKIVAYAVWSANKTNAANKQSGHQFPSELSAHRATIQARQRTEETIIRTIITTVLSEHIGRRWRELGRRLGITDVELDDIERRCNINLRGLKEMTVESLLLWLDRQPYWPNIFDVWWALQDMQMASVADIVLATVHDERNLAGIKDECEENEEDGIEKDGNNDLEEEMTEQKEKGGSEAETGPKPSSERSKEPSVSATVVPMEVEMGGPELRALYDRACEEGYTEVYNTRFVLVGKFGQEDHFPHAVANVMKKLRHERQRAKQPNLPTRQSQSQPDSDVMDITEAMKKTRIVKEGGKEPKAPTKDKQSQPDVDLPDTTTINKRVEQAPHPLPSVAKRPQGTIRETFQAYLRATKIFRKQDDKSNVTGTKEHPHISIWDFGGQEIFYSTQQVFYTHRAIYGMTMDLTKPIDNPVEMSTDSGPTSHCHKEKDFIDYHLESIRAHTRPAVLQHEVGRTPAARDIEPPVMFIFTNKD